MRHTHITKIIWNFSIISYQDNIQTIEATFIPTREYVLGYWALYDPLYARKEGG